MRALQRYRIHLGTAAWILHRLAGLALILYLLVHIWVIHHLIGGQQSFDKIMEFFNNPLAKALEIGLVGVILYHLWNGLRVTLIDMGVMVERQKALFAAAVVVWLVTWGVVAYAMLTKVGGLLSALAKIGGGGLS
ncbi:MAG: succinate dehydrogenase, cytochrome b556 subunit [Candidatus Krumholzibacteria bacterium]|nr:succinate dehydrogenase, cytochrome b556 subunit [Candidatus Krumholzibacteria bacterium]